MEQIFEFLWHGGLNPYDLYRNCDPNPDTNSVKMQILKSGITPRFLSSNFTRRIQRPTVRLVHKSYPHGYNV